MRGIIMDMVEDGPVGWVMLTLLTVAVGILVFLVFVLVHAIWLDIAHPCVRSHQEWKRHPAWTQIMPVGKVMVPIFHPAHEGFEYVCDERS